MNPYWPPTSLHTPIQTLIKHLLQAPSLYLPDYTKPLFLFVHSRQRHALGILCQKGRYIWGPLAYLSKQLHLIMLRWLPCLQALAATTLLITETPKTNPKCSSKCMLTSFLQRFTVSSGFPFSAPCLTTNPPHTPPRPVPFFHAS